MSTATEPSRRDALLRLLAYVLVAAPGAAAFWYLSTNDPGIAFLALTVA